MDPFCHQESKLWVLIQIYLWRSDLNMPHPRTRRVDLGHHSKFCSLSVSPIMLAFQVKSVVVFRVLHSLGPRTLARRIEEMEEVQTHRHMYRGAGIR